jgi:hypothetical protein
VVMTEMLMLSGVGDDYGKMNYKKVGADRGPAYMKTGGLRA